MTSFLTAKYSIIFSFVYFGSSSFILHILHLWKSNSVFVYFKISIVKGDERQLVVDDKSKPIQKRPISHTLMRSFVKNFSVWLWKRKSDSLACSATSKWEHTLGVLYHIGCTTLPPFMEREWHAVDVMLFEWCTTNVRMDMRLIYAWYVGNMNMDDLWIICIGCMNEAWMICKWYMKAIWNADNVICDWRKKNIQKQ